MGGSVANGLTHQDDLEDSTIVARVNNGSSTATGTYGSVNMDVYAYTITGTIIPHDWQGAYTRINLGEDEVFQLEGAQWFRQYEALHSLAIKPEFENESFEVGSRLVVLGVGERWLPTSESLS